MNGLLVAGTTSDAGKSEWLWRIIENGAPPAMPALAPGALA
jgi:hypothetical protein